MCPFKVVFLCKVVTLFGPLENFLRGNHDTYVTYVCVNVCVFELSTSSCHSLQCGLFYNQK